MELLDFYRSQVVSSPHVDFFERIAADWLVLLIPLFSALVGWFTNVVAIKMMFYPTDFVGVRPILGWQGIIPANARRLAKMSTQLILTKLLSLEELFAGFEGEEFGDELETVVDEITEQVIDEIATKRAPQMWENAGEFMQNSSMGRTPRVGRGAPGVGGLTLPVPCR